MPTVLRYRNLHKFCFFSILCTGNFTIPSFPSYNQFILCTFLIIIHYLFLKECQQKKYLCNYFFFCFIHSKYFFVRDQLVNQSVSLFQEFLTQAMFGEETENSCHQGTCQVQPAGDCAGCAGGCNACARSRRNFEKILRTR